MATPAETAAQQLAWELESWSSIELRLRSQFISARPDDPAALDYTGIIEEHYIETARGQRVFDSDIPDKPNGGRSTDYADGRRFGSLSYTRTNREQQQQLIVNNTFSYEGNLGVSHRPVPLNVLYVGLTPLPRALSAPGVISLGQSRLLGRDADRFVIPGPPGKTQTRPEYVYAIDRATGFPLEMVVYLTPQDREAGWPSHSWVADSFDPIQGHYFPRVSRSTFYNPGSSSEKATATHQVTELAFDRDYPASTFWPALQPGVMIWDRGTGKHWHQPNPDGTPFVKPQTVVSAPIRATEPVHWSTWAPYVGVGLGATLLLAVVFHRWRNATR